MIVLDPVISVTVNTCTHYSLLSYVAIGWIKYECKNQLKFKKYSPQDYDNLVGDLANAVIHSTMNTFSKYQLMKVE